jgi:hypothetical protein
MKRAVLIVAVAALCVAGSAVAQDRSGGLIGSRTRADDGQVLGSGSATGQVLGSGGFTMSTDDQVMGSGGRTADDRQIYGSGSRAEDSGLSILELRLLDGSRLLVVSSYEGMFVIRLEE